jgi:cytochrome P450
MEFFEKSQLFISELEVYRYSVNFKVPASQFLGLTLTLTQLLAFLVLTCVLYKNDAIGAQKCPKRVKRMRGHYPIIGSLRTAIKVNDRYFILTRTNELVALEFEKWNDIPMTFSLPFQPAIIVINDVASIEHILSTKFDNYIKGPIYIDNFKQVFGNGIFNCDGAKWYKQRKLSARLFTAKTFKTSFETVFMSNITSFIHRLDDSLDKPVDMHDLFHRFFLDSFSKIAFNVCSS